MFSFQIADLKVPHGHTPTFDQLFTIPPNEAIELRKSYLPDQVRDVLRAEILYMLEELMRQNPYGKTFVTTAQLVKDAEMRNGGQIPRFRVI